MDEKCECGRVQEDKHIYECSKLEFNSKGMCIKDDTNEINDNDIQLVTYWTDKI